MFAVPLFFLAAYLFRVSSPRLRVEEGITSPDASRVYRVGYLGTARDHKKHTYLCKWRRGWSLPGGPTVDGVYTAPIMAQHGNANAKRQPSRSLSQFEQSKKSRGCDRDVGSARIRTGRKASLLHRHGMSGHSSRLSLVFEPSILFSDIGINNTLPFSASS